MTDHIVTRTRRPVLVVRREFDTVEVQVRGLQGVDGTSIKIIGVYDTLEALQTAHPTGAIGDAYMVGVNAYIWDDINGAWYDVGPFRGPPGENGADGQIRFTGHGAPGTIVGSRPNDTYLDLDTGAVYKLM